MPARYECLCAETVPYSLIAMRENNIRKCRRDGCLQWQHVGCSKDAVIVDRAREKVRCNDCFAPSAAALRVVHREPTPEPASAFVNIDDRKMTAEEEKAKKLHETKELMACRKEEKRLREIAEQQKLEAQQQAKIAAEQARLAKVKAEAEAAAAARDAKAAEELAARKHSDELRRKRKGEEQARYEGEQAKKRKLELEQQQAERQMEDQKRAAVQRLAEEKRQAEEEKLAQERKEQEVREAHQLKMKRKVEKYEAQMAGLKGKIAKTEGAKSEVPRAVMVPSSMSEDGRQTAAGGTQEDPDQQPGRRWSASATSSGESLSNRSNWSRPSGTGQSAMGRSLLDRNSQSPGGDRYSHKPGRGSFSVSNFTSTQSQPRVTGSMRDHPSAPGQPTRVKLLDQLKTTTAPTSTSVPASANSQPSDNSGPLPQLDGTSDSNEAMSSNDRVKQWRKNSNMRTAKAHGGSRKVTLDAGVKEEDIADQMEAPIKIADPESSDEENIELPVLGHYPEIASAIKNSAKSTPAPPVTGQAPV